MIHDPRVHPADTPRTTPEQQNARRAERGSGTIAAYIRLVGDEYDDANDAVSDLLTDLRHHCAHAGVDFDAAEYRAFTNYQAERP
jgi:hypothetical protein